MKSTVYGSMVLALSLLISTPALAAYDGPNAVIVTGISAISGAPDDCLCVIEGNIVEKVKGKKDYYVMKDATGQILVEIDDELFSGQTVTPNDKIRAHGRVDKDNDMIGKKPDMVEVYFFEII